MSDEIFDHPAYAQIGASRVTGHTALYDSDFHHQHYVTISIRRSALHRGLSRNWHMGGDELIEVSLSESQWATFVSSMNVGFGVPCTLSRHGGELIDRLPPPKNPAHLFKEELKKTMAEIQEDMVKVAEELDGAMSKTKVDALKKRLGLMASRLTGSTGFVADQFDEHMEDTVEKAKIEIGAHAMAMIQRAGLEALGVKMAPAIAYGETVKKSITILKKDES